MTIAAESVVDVFDEEFQRNPYGVLREARTRARCARDPFGSLILLRADDFEAVATDGRFGAFGDRLARMRPLTSCSTQFCPAAKWNSSGSSHRASR
jgi:hypothetical protein